MMAIEHLKALKGLHLGSRIVEGRKVSGAVRKAVLTALTWEIAQGEDWTYKSLTSVAAQTELSRRQVQAAVRSLEEEGFLTPVAEVRGRRWKGKSKAYLVDLRHRDAQADPGPATSGQLPATSGQETCATEGRPIGDRELKDSKISGTEYLKRRGVASFQELVKLGEAANAS